MKYKLSKYDRCFNDFKSKYGEIIAVCLCNAGISTIEEADKYLYDKNLINPGLIPDISNAELLITETINANQKICIFGDYDADGVTSSAILYTALKKLGADVFVRLPDRIEGYGISMAAIKECIDKNAKLIITVDNGIRAIDEIAFAKDNNIKVLILDHHVPGDDIPNADCIIDLHWFNDSYPYIHLTGSGLAFNVALYLHQHTDFNAMSLVDLAAIGTIADVETLIGVNRVIVKLAIEQMRDKNYNRYGIIKLYPKDLSFITAEDIAFQIGPCINACGRLDRHGAELPLSLLLCEDPEEAELIAEKVIERNEERKRIQAECYDKLRTEACERISNGDSILVVLSEDAPTGIVGLLAGNLKEEFNKPSIVFGINHKDDGTVIYTGSARSIDGYNILNGITECSELLIRFGGHEYAAGMSIEPNNLDAFRKKINLLSPLSESDSEHIEYYNLEMDEDQAASEATFKALNACEPFGKGNPKPVFKVKATTYPTADGLYSSMGKDKKHLKLHASSLDLVGFNMIDAYKSLGSPRKIYAYGTLGINHFSGNISKQLLMDFMEAIPEVKTDLMSSLASLLNF